jgi:sugar transferase (PEP-CTERM/EpsH1 system associated)
MPICIMHVVDTLGKGGLENGLVNLIERLDPQRFKHVVFAIRELGLNAQRLPSERVRVMRAGEKASGSRFQVAAIARAIREVGPDIVHSRNWAAIEAVVAAWWSRRPAIIHSEHGIESDVNVLEPWRRICFRRLSYGLADQVISVSAQLRDLHAQRTGFAKERIGVIHNGVDCRRFHPHPGLRARMRSELKLSDGDLCVGCVGNLLPVKDHMTLLRALPKLNSRLKCWHLVVAGDGPERAKLEAFVCAHAEWRDRVRFLGLSNRVSELLNALDVYILPSIFEGISNSLLEAMATGLPVVVAATGGNPEVVVDGESGLMFPAGDADALGVLLERLLEQPSLRSKIGEQAKRRVNENFSIDSMVQKYDELYHSVIPSAAAPLRALAGV